MSNRDAADVDEAATQPMPSDQLTAGQLLKQAREAAGLHIAAMAVSMKIPVKKIEALESDRVDLLHDAVFVRALASSVCRHLKIDPAPVMRLLPQNTSPQIVSNDRGINTPFRPSGEASKLSAPNFLMKPWSLVVVVLLVAALLLLIWPSIAKIDLFGSHDTDSSASEVSVADVVAEPITVVNAITTSAPAIDTVRAVSSPVANVPADISSRASGALAEAAVAASSPQGQSPVVPLQFRARGTSWVQVVDAKGVVQLSRTLNAGDSAEVTGALPLSVVVGRVDVIDLNVFGKTFEFGSVAKENVARFEVKQ
jgi:cytoskeleton protein RodZ